MDFLKQVYYAASTENDRDFSSIFFQWQNNKITANASNRIRIALSKMETGNSNDHNILKFSCDKKSIHNVIKGAQNFEKESLIIKIIPSGRIFFFLGKQVIIEVGYYKNRGINVEKFFDCMDDCCSFLCSTYELKQALQAPKSFATKFHYSVLIEHNKDMEDRNNLNNKENGVTHESPKEPQNVTEEGANYASQMEQEPHNNLDKDQQIRFYFQEPNHGTVESYLSCEFLNQQQVLPQQQITGQNQILPQEDLLQQNNFAVEMNILYLAEAVAVIDSKQCCVMINKQNSYIFLIPIDTKLLKDNETFSPVKLRDNYHNIHLLMCIR